MMGSSLSQEARCNLSPQRRKPWHIEQDRGYSLPYSAGRLQETRKPAPTSDAHTPCYIVECKLDLSLPDLRRTHIWTVWLLGETVANADRLVVCLVAPGKGTPTQDINCPTIGKRALPEWPFNSLSTQSITWMPIHKQDLANGDYAPLRHLLSPSTTRQKQMKRGGEHRSGRSGLKWEKKASANSRGAVLEKMVYNFDVVCLQETRTCPHRPLVYQGFTVIQRHQGSGMAIVVRGNLSKTVSSFNFDKWSTSSRE